MAQESIDDFIQMAKDYAKAEMDLEVQKWVFVNFERIDEQGNFVRLFCYDLPRDIYERKKWVAEWRKAKLVCKYPKGNVRYTVSFYDKRIGHDIKLNEDLKRLLAAKAQVTRLQRKIENYVTYNKAHNLFFDERTDDDLIKARGKLAIKLTNVQKAEERLKLKINELQNDRRKN